MMDVIATGMVAALGYDVHTVCAAARAGISRAGDMPFVTIENDRSPGLATGHAAQLLTDGFDGDARLARLLSGAFEDLAPRLPEALLSGGRTAFYLALPAGAREWQALGLIATDDSRAQYLERLGPAPDIPDRARGQALLDRSLQLAGLDASVRGAAQRLQLSTAGHAAVSGLFMLAQRDIEAGRVDVAVVIGVDALVGTTTLSWLNLTGRLKSPDTPSGITPGEAAAIVVLARPGVAADGPTASHASVMRVATGLSASQLLTGDAAEGVALSTIVRTLAHEVGAREIAWVVSDQNGEVFRATDWGCALARLRGDGLTVSDDAVWYPASSVGDVGAATGAVAACIVNEAFARGYSRARHAWLLASSDGPPRSGCVMVGKEA